MSSTTTSSFLADLEQFARVTEAAPGHVGDVKQAVHAVEVDERAEVGEVLDGALDDVADVDRLQEFLALLGAFLLDEFAAAEDDVFAVVVDFDDLEIVGVADELLEILRGNDVDLRAGQECLDADVDGEAAFDDGADLAFDETVALEDFHDLVPVLSVGGFFLREHDHSLVIFEPLEEHFDFVANLQILHVVKFGERNDAFGFVADVHEHFARTDFQDAAFNDAAFFEIAKTFRDQLFHFDHNDKLTAKPRLPCVFPNPGSASMADLLREKG